jgi:hypothetical protein
MSWRRIARGIRRASDDCARSDTGREAARNQRWKIFEYEPGEFEKFAHAKTPAGLSVEDGVQGLIRICRANTGEDSEVALRLMRGLIPAASPHVETKGGRGNKTSDIVRGFGNSETYLLRRLKRDH